MKRSVAVLFGTDGSLSLLAEVAEGAHCTIQNALVNVLTPKGVDPVFPDRGTNFVVSMLDGSAIDLRSASHVANFAASDTIFFLAEHGAADIADSLNQMTLTPSDTNISDMEASFETADGRSFSYSLSGSLN